jgi:hypothetical protein
MEEQAGFSLVQMTRLVAALHAPVKERFVMTLLDRQSVSIVSKGHVGGSLLTPLQLASACTACLEPRLGGREVGIERWQRQALLPGVPILCRPWESFRL